MSQADLLARRLGPDYNCANLAVEAWAAETGEDISPFFAGVLRPAGARRADPRLRARFRPASRPSSPCLVLFRRGRVAQPHVGVFVRGRVLHLTRDGVIRQPLAVASLGYTSVRYYAPRSANH